jgi:2-keto-3-deoxy-L-rhamnonate aldolase RhmA
MPLREVNSTLNAETLLIAMLETAEGIENADAIAQTGVDVLLIGSNDLCTELGIPGELRHPKLLDAFHKTAGACRAHGKVLGIGGVRGDLELQSNLFKLGGRFIIAGSDVTYFTAAASADAKRLREKLTP